MLKNGQTYFMYTLSMFDHFATLCNKGLKTLKFAA